MLQAWRQVIRELPMVHAGWRLEQVTCDVKECVATWVRLYGTYDDFFKQLPSQSSHAKEVQTGDDALQAKVVSYHPIPEISAEKHFAAAQLPRMDRALREMASQLQDFSLLGKVKVEINKPTLFGGTQNPGSLTDAIMSGRWKVQDDAGTLDYLMVPQYGIPEQLKLQVAGTAGQASMSYEFVGQYYVQAPPK